jgi:hypothetical protein
MVFVIGGASSVAYANDEFYFGTGAGRAEYSSIDELYDETIDETEELARGEFVGGFSKYEIADINVFAIDIVFSPE